MKKFLIIVKDFFPCPVYFWRWKHNQRIICHNTNDFCDSQTQKRRRASSCLEIFIQDIFRTTMFFCLMEDNFCHRTETTLGGTKFLYSLHKLFFVVLAYHKPVLQGFDWHYQASVHLPISRAFNKSLQYPINFSKIIFWEMPRIKPGAAWWEVLCHPVDKLTFIFGPTQGSLWALSQVHLFIVHQESC